MQQIKEFLVKLLAFMGAACWVEIKTEHPACTYYFGPFLTEQEAAIAQKGYLEDLESEAAIGIKIQIKRFRPDRLTIFEENEDKKTYQGITPLSGQIS
jgi:hypothetical protein